MATGRGWSLGSLGYGTDLGLTYSAGHTVKDRPMQKIDSVFNTGELSPHTKYRRYASTLVLPSTHTTLRAQ